MKSRDAIAKEFRMRRAGLSLTAMLLLPVVATAQNGGFVAGSRDLFVLDLALVPVDEFPKQLMLLKGDVRVVQKFGKPMLRASDQAQLLIEFADELPQDFTLEFDLVPKLNCNPEDLSFEGTAEIDQGPSSMNVLWQSTHVGLVGGAEQNKEIPMPEDLTVKARGNLTQVRASFAGTAFKLYTNGKEIVNESGRKFVRGRLLRVGLGGQDERMCSVHLAKLRVATSSPRP
jgi:hypothetical protein